MAEAPDYEAEYDNRARVPEHPAIFARWASEAAAWRAELPPEALPYGPTERTAVDLFHAGDGPAVLFVHGGYWQAMDRSSFSHMARGLSLRGATVGVAGYDLCPQVSLSDIVDEIRGACRAVWRRTGQSVIVAGHSAGGHLAACMLATNWRSEPDVGVDLVPAASAISGLFDLEPLRSTRLNAAIALTEAEAGRLSPAFWPPPAGKTFDASVGELESAEYQRQSRLIVDRWGAAGVCTRLQVIAQANHFTAIAPLADPGSAMVERILELRHGAA